MEGAGMKRTCTRMAPRRRAAVQMHLATRFAIGGLAVLAAEAPARALTIHLNYTPSVTSLPNAADVENACNYAAQSYENLFSDPEPFFTTGQVYLDIMATFNPSVAGQNLIQVG